MDEKDTREHCCCFTGHRPAGLRMTEQRMNILLESAIRDAVDRRFTTFISGMAPGADICAAETVLKLRENNSRLKLVCALPFEDFGRHWSGGWTERFLRVMALADEKHCICGKPFRSAFQRRNEWMVNHSGLVIAVYQGGNGGTKNTLNYAQKNGVPCVIIDGTS